MNEKITDEKYYDVSYDEYLDDWWESRDENEFTLKELELRAKEDLGIVILVLT